MGTASLGVIYTGFGAVAGARYPSVTLMANGFDIVPYFPLVMGGYLMTAPGMLGMVIGFLLLDERDARTLSALCVTPLSMRQYPAYRIASCRHWSSEPHRPSWGIR